MTRVNPYITDRVVSCNGDDDFTEEQWELQFRSQEVTYRHMLEDPLFDEEDLEDLFG